MNIAVVGATGLVGLKIIEVLQEKNIKFDDIYLYASSKSKGKKILINNVEHEVMELTEENLDKKHIDVALFSAGGQISSKYVPYLANKNVTCIDNSSVFRNCKDVPLVVPEINATDIKEEDRIISNPNCSTIQAVLPLSVIHNKYQIKRIVYSTYQAVSGAGKRGIDDLKNTSENYEMQVFPYEIVDNCIPHIDIFFENGYTKEEMKMITETQKILHDDSIKITATAVRVPVVNSHSESINVELYNNFDIDDIKSLLSNSKGIIVCDDIKNQKYPLATQATGHDEVFVGRIRRDLSVDNGINMWVVADNIRKGAASNAIQILEYLQSTRYKNK